LNFYFFSTPSFDIQDFAIDTPAFSGEGTVAASFTGTLTLKPVGATGNIVAGTFENSVSGVLGQWKIIDSSPPVFTDGFETPLDQCHELDDFEKCDDGGGDTCFSGTCVDTIAPDAPILDPLDAGQVDTTVVITGYGESVATVVVYATCDLGSGGTDFTTADTNGDFSLAWLMAPGETCSFFAVAVDAFSNTSDDSNTVSTKICDPPVPCP